MSPTLPITHVQCAQQHKALKWPSGPHAFTDANTQLSWTPPGSKFAIFSFKHFFSYIQLTLTLHYMCLNGFICESYPSMNLTVFNKTEENTWKDEKWAPYFPVTLATQLFYISPVSCPWVKQISSRVLLRAPAVFICLLLLEMVALRLKGPFLALIELAI